MRTGRSTPSNERPAQNSGVCTQTSSGKPATELPEKQVGILRQLYQKHLGEYYSDGARAEAKREFLEKFPDADGRTIKKHLREISVEGGAIPENAPVPAVTTDSTGFPNDDFFGRVQFMTFDEVRQRSAQNNEPPKQIPDPMASPSPNAGSSSELNASDWYNEAFKPLSADQMQSLEQMYTQTLELRNNNAEWARIDTEVAFAEKYPQTSVLVIGEALDKLQGKAK